MGNISYLNYKELSGFYTAQSVANLLRMSVPDLIKECERQGIRIQRDASSRYVLSSSAVKKLHYRLYHESRGRNIPNSRRDAQWA